MLLGRPGATVKGAAGTLTHRYRDDLEDRETQVRRQARRVVHHRLHRILLMIWEQTG